MMYNNMMSKVKVFLVLVALVGGLAFANPVAADTTVGECNQALGHVLVAAHGIINSGSNAQCADIFDIFVEFFSDPGVGCNGLLQDGELFFNAAVGQYMLACDVFTNPDFCGFVGAPQSVGLCIFE